MANRNKKKAERPNVLSIEQLASMSPIPGTGSLPDKYKKFIREEPGFYIHSRKEPEIKIASEKIKNSKDIWKISLQPGERISDHLPIAKSEFLEKGKLKIKKSHPVSEAFRPSWATLEYLPKIIPHRSPFRKIRKHRHAGISQDPLIQFLDFDMNEALTNSYPWSCIGKVVAGDATGSKISGTGVLVGPNLMMTAAHLQQWHQPGWWMQFRAGFREDVWEGESYVASVHGYMPDDEPTGYDYIICQLYNPLGEMLGWMGSQSFGDEDDYYDNRWITVGYPGVFFEGKRPRVYFAVEIEDIDNDDPGLELETDYDVGFGGGFSGAPLWGNIDNDFRIIGIKSGYEADGWDSVRGVNSGGNAMVDLIKYGLANFH